MEQSFLSKGTTRWQGPSDLSPAANHYTCNRAHTPHARMTENSGSAAGTNLSGTLGLIDAAEI